MNASTIRRYLQTSICVALLASSSSVLGGCLVVAAAGAGAGTYAYISGELSSVEEAKLDRTWSATQAAIKDLQFTVKEQSKDALQARLVATQADNTDVKVTLESQGEKLTKIKIRIGVFGDEAKSRLILDKIKKGL